MRILFMGTPDFAAKSLERLISCGHDICGVIAQPDRPKGRGMKLIEPPVKQAAKKHGIEVYQPTALKNGALLPLLQSLAPDLIVVVAYGRILPEYILDFPKYSAINLHGSMLPEYRGAAPIQRSVIDGRRATGVTTMYMASELDAGDIIMQRSMEILPEETSGELFTRMAEVGAELLCETVGMIEAGNAPRRAQQHDMATYAQIIEKHEGNIDWSMSAQRIAALIRGLDPWPCAYSMLCGKKVKLYHAVHRDAANPNCGSEYGRITELVKNEGIVVLCGDGNEVIIREIQPEGGKRMSAEAFFNGHRDMLNGKFEKAEQKG